MRSISLGMTANPSMMVRPKKMTRPMTMLTVEPRAGESPASRGAAIERMMTCPTSSNTVMLTMAVACSFVTVLLVWSTPTTTAVLVPDMIAPRKMEAVLPSPMAIPPR